MPPVQKPEELKAALVGRRVSDDADKIPVEFGADGSIKLALYKLDWKWQTAEGTYAVSEGGKVEYTAKLSGLTIRRPLHDEGCRPHRPVGVKPGREVEEGAKGASVERRHLGRTGARPRGSLPQSVRTGGGPGGQARLAQRECPRFKPVVQRDEHQRLKSADFAFENNAVPPGKNAAKAKDDSRPFFYVSVQLWSGRTQSPPANLYEFQWQGQTYQMWVRVYGSNAELVKMIRKSIDEPLT